MCKFSANTQRSELKKLYTLSRQKWYLGELIGGGKREGKCQIIKKGAEKPASVKI